MARHFLRAAACAALFASLLIASASAQSHVALIIGNGSYQTAPSIKTAHDDAAIVTETMRGAGYDMTELNDVRQADIGQAIRGFLDKAAAAGPDGVAFFYYAGHAAQSKGENYLVPVDAVINRDDDVANEAFRLNDLVGELAKLPLTARIVVIDASRDHKFGEASGQAVAKGLAKIDVTPGLLIAFAAAPGAVVSTKEDEAYSLYTMTLVTFMRQPGLTMPQILKAMRQKVSDATASRQVPWIAGGLSTELFLFAAAAPAPQPETPAPAPQAEPAAGHVDFSQVPCRKFLATGQTEIGTILAWLDGYYAGQSEQPVFDVKRFTTNVKRLAEYCAANPNAGLIDASDRVYGGGNKGRRAK